MSPLPSGSFRRKKTHTCALWPTNQMLLAPSHSRALSPRKREKERGGAARMSSSLSLTMSVSGPQNRRLFCGTCWRWGESRVTLGLGHARASCPGSPGMGRDPAFSGKGSTAGLTTATSHHLPPGVTLPTNFSCKRQGCDRTRKTNRRRVRPRHSDRRATRGRTHLAAAGRRTGDSTPGSGGWLRPTARRFVPPLRKAFPRATPTSRLCTLHHSRADVTAQSPGKLSPPPQSPEPGRGPRPSCGFI